MTRSPARTGRLAGAGAVVLLLAAPAAAREDPREPGDAMAFVRLVGDIRADFVDVWRQPLEEENVELATGSGFVIAPSGLILTNQHVVDDTPVLQRIGRHEAEIQVENQKIEVALGREGAFGIYEAWVVASDPELDLAVLQVTASDLPYLPFGDSDAAVEGRPVTVLGFPFGRLAAVGKREEATAVPRATVTAGSLSAVRPDDAGSTRYLQTSASVNPGSSGGPMVDEDGYVVGVVRMKLSREASGPGAGFAVPVNMVKDFLEAEGLLGQLPSERLYPGVAHDLDWKGLRVDWPEGFADVSPTRLQVDTGEPVAGLVSSVWRVSSPWDLDDLEEALLEGRGWPGFAPGRARVLRREEGRRGRLGSALGEDEDGSLFRVEYALLDLGAEQIVARYVGRPDDVAFNLGLVKRALESLEARALLDAEVKAPLEVRFEPVAYPGGASGEVPLPSAWSVEPASFAACSAVPGAEAGLAASPPGDFTVVLRVLRWVGAVPDGAELARGCGGAERPGGGSYSGRFDRLGLEMAVQATLVEGPDELLLLEVEAPEARLPFVRDLYREWRRRVTE